MGRWTDVACLALLCLGGACRLSVAAPLPAQFELPRMKTSIYIGSVSLATSAFAQDDESYTATYEAKVSPWAFWNESGTIAIKVTPDAYKRLQQGEAVELTGEAKNHKGKPRQVSARVQQTAPTIGNIKVRIAAGGTTLIFNSTYRVIEAESTSPDAPSTAGSPAHSVQLDGS